MAAKAKKNKPKSHSGAKKRFEVTATGKVKRKQANNNHILTKESRNVKRDRNKTAIVAKSDEKNIRKLLGE